MKKSVGGFFLLIALAGCSHQPNFPAEATTDIKIPPPHEKTVRDLKDGESGCARIFFTSDGTPIIGPWSTVECGWFTTGDTIWRSNGKLLGRLSRMPDPIQYITFAPGYERVYLVEYPK